MVTEYSCPNLKLPSRTRAFPNFLTSNFADGLTLISPSIFCSISSSSEKLTRMRGLRPASSVLKLLGSIFSNGEIEKVSVKVYSRSRGPLLMVTLKFLVLLVLSMSLVVNLKVLSSILLQISFTEASPLIDAAFSTVPRSVFSVNETVPL